MTVLAHQVPVLAAKRRWPALDGVAMVVGSMAPDLAQATSRTTARYFLGQPLWWDGHSVRQQFQWCLPVGLLLTWAVRRFLAPRLAPYLPDLGSVHLRDVALVARTRHRWWVVVASVLLGSFSHIALDQLTHADSALARAVPLLQRNVFHHGGDGVEVALALQVVLSVVLSAVAVVQVSRIGRERALWSWAGLPVGALPSPRRPVAVVRAVVLTALLAAAVVASTQHARGVTVVLMTWSWLAAAVAVLAAVLVGRPVDPAPTSRPAAPAAA